MRSAGTSSASRHQISVDDLKWADLILVMEQEHKTQISHTFRSLIHLPQIESLDIPDIYLFMDDELIVRIRESTEAYLTDD